MVGRVTDPELGVEKLTLGVGTRVGGISQGPVGGSGVDVLLGAKLTEARGGRGAGGCARVAGAALGS